MKQKPRSSYTSEIVDHQGRRFLMLVDEDRGGISLTNDIRNVIEFECEREELNPSDTGVVYRDRDSDGLWAGYDYSEDCFVMFNKQDLDQIMGKLSLRLK